MPWSQVTFRANTWNAVGSILRSWLSIPVNPHMMVIWDAGVQQFTNGTLWDAGATTWDNLGTIWDPVPIFTISNTFWDNGTTNWIG